MKANTLKAPVLERTEEIPAEVQRQEPKQKFFAKLMFKVLGGAYLESDKSIKNLPFLFYVALLALLYITNGYVIEGNTRTINGLQKEVNELRYEYITLKSELLTLSRQSKISGKLEKMGIKENMEPVKTITIFSGEESINE